MVPWQPSNSVFNNGMKMQCLKIKFQYNFNSSPKFVITYGGKHVHFIFSHVKCAWNNNYW